ncbi:MAG: hypothetical protein R3Y05_02535 [bacterium]
MFEYKDFHNIRGFITTNVKLEYYTNELTGNIYKRKPSLPSKIKLVTIDGDKYLFTKTTDDSILKKGLYFWICKEEIRTTVYELIKNTIPFSYDKNNEFTFFNSTASKLNIENNEKFWNKPIILKKGEIIYIGKGDIKARKTQHNLSELSGTGALYIGLRPPLVGKLEHYHHNRIETNLLKNTTVESNLRKNYKIRFGK